MRVTGYSCHSVFASPFRFCCQSAAYTPLLNSKGSRGLRGEISKLTPLHAIMQYPPPSYFAGGCVACCLWLEACTLLKLPNSAAAPVPIRKSSAFTPKSHKRTISFLQACSVPPGCFDRLPCNAPLRCVASPFSTLPSTATIAASARLCFSCRPSVPCCRPSFCPAVEPDLPPTVHVNDFVPSPTWNGRWYLVLALFILSTVVIYYCGENVRHEIQACDFFWLHLVAFGCISTDSVSNWRSATQLPMSAHLSLTYIAVFIHVSLPDSVYLTCCSAMPL